MGLYTARRVKKVGDGRASGVTACPGPAGSGCHVSQESGAAPPPLSRRRRPGCRTPNFTSAPLCRRCRHFRPPGLPLLRGGTARLPPPSPADKREPPGARGAAAWGGEGSRGPGWAADYPDGVGWRVFSVFFFFVSPVSFELVGVSGAVLRAELLRTGLPPLVIAWLQSAVRL